MATVEVLRANGTRETHELPRRGLLQAIYRLIGCDTVDAVNLRDGRVMLVDDVGMLINKPINDEATRLYHGVCRAGTVHPIVGDVAICLDEEFA